MRNQIMAISLGDSLGRNLTMEDQVAFYKAGLPLPADHHGPRADTADQYAWMDRQSRNQMLGHMVDKESRAMQPGRRWMLSNMERRAFVGLNLDEVEV